MIFFLILALALFQCTVAGYLEENPDFYQLDSYTWETEDFRAMRLGEAAAASEGLTGEEVAALMVENDYDLTSLKSLDWDGGPLLKRRPGDYRKLSQAYETVLGDLEWFPIPKSLNPDTPDISYEDGWMDERSYGAGEGQESRGHEGCDLMGLERPRGFYPVVSMSAGVVEQAGWLELGGWRLGIRAPGGAYLYYAHLYGYSKPWKAGDLVEAGELLGYMGDSGYGSEGTVGKFGVHLHVGIYLETDHYEEMSVNPYWILRYLEKRRLAFRY